MSWVQSPPLPTKKEKYMRIVDCLGREGRESKLDMKQERRDQ
jgi:hypothetical protein